MNEPRIKGRFVYELLSKYPHMKPYDVAIWERFIKLNPEKFDRVDYDLPVGNCRECHNDLKPEYERDKNILGAYKIDVVGYKDEEIFTIEIKPKAGSKALGQAIQYDYLYTRDFKPTGPTHAMIITDEEMPDMRELCNEHNIILSVV